jgi:hypothetical protein
MYLVSVGDYSLELKSSLCDYPCIWQGIIPGTLCSCYEWESCWTRKPYDLIETAEEIYMVTQKRITHVRRKRR